MVDHRLTSAVGSFFVLRGHVSREPIAIWLSFDEAPPYRFAGASDGWHFLVDAKPPIEVDMQESGTIRLRDMGASEPFCNSINSCLRQGWVITSASPEDIIGVRFDFDHSVVRILNWGDEIHVAAELPSDAKADEIREWPI